MKAKTNVDSLRLNPFDPDKLDLQQRLTLTKSKPETRRLWQKSTLIEEKEKADLTLKRHL